MHLHLVTMYISLVLIYLFIFILILNAFVSCDHGVSIFLLYLFIYSFLHLILNAFVSCYHGVSIFLAHVIRMSCHVNRISCHSNVILKHTYCFFFRSLSIYLYLIHMSFNFFLLLYLEMKDSSDKKIAELKKKRCKNSGTCHDKCY